MSICSVGAEGEGEMIRARYRTEFEQIGVDDLRKRLVAGLFDEEKRRHGYLWLDEQEHGEDRAISKRSSDASERSAAAAERSAAAAERANRRATVAILIAIGAALASWWPMIAKVLPN